MNKQISTITSISILLILGILACGFIYWRSSQVEKELTLLPLEINVPARKIVLEQAVVPVVAKEEKYLRLIAPKGKERLCIGDDFNIEWESKGIETVGISMGDSAGGYAIDQVLATRNETGLPKDEGKGIYIWKVGYTRGIIHGESEVRKIQISGGGLVTESGYFALVNCKG